jgi:hypothetical protein
LVQESFRVCVAGPGFAGVPAGRSARVASKRIGAGITVVAKSAEKGLSCNDLAFLPVFDEVINVRK